MITNAPDLSQKRMMVSCQITRKTNFDLEVEAAREGMSKREYVASLLERHGLEIQLSEELANTLARLARQWNTSRRELAEKAIRLGLNTLRRESRL